MIGTDDPHLEASVDYLHLLNFGSQFKYGTEDGFPCYTDFSMIVIPSEQPRTAKLQKYLLWERHR